MISFSACIISSYIVLITRVSNCVGVIIWLRSVYAIHIQSRNNRKDIIQLSHSLCFYTREAPLYGKKNKKRDSSIYTGYNQHIEQQQQKVGIFIFEAVAAASILDEFHTVAHVCHRLGNY